MTTSPFATDFYSAPETALSPIEELWEAVREYLHTAYVMFGSPKVLAEKAWLSLSQYRACADWLYRCEELLRRLIFINAKFFALPLRRLARAFPSAGKYKPLAFDPDYPGRWRVSFAMKLGPPASSPASSSRIEIKSAGGDSLGPRNEPPNVVSCLSLARRFEALRRAALQPMGPTLRLVRILQRRKNVAQLARRLARPTRSYASFNTKPGDLAIADACKIVVEDGDAWTRKYKPDSS